MNAAQASARQYTFVSQQDAMSVAFGCVLAAGFCLAIFFGFTFAIPNFLRWVALGGVGLFLYKAYRFGWSEPFMCSILADGRIAFRAPFRWRYVHLNDVLSMDQSWRGAALKRGRERMLRINLKQHKGSIAVAARGDDQKLIREIYKNHPEINVKEELLKK